MRGAIVKRVLLFGLSVVCATGSWAQSAWLPEPGAFVGTGTVVYQSFDEFWRGEDRNPTPFGNLHQTTLLIGVERSISDNVAFDGTIGYTSTEGTEASGLGESGLTDSSIGVRWRVVDELRRPGAATVTLRLGGIVEGTYDIATPAAPGDGASGAVGTLMVGKLIGDTRAGVHGSAGYRTMAEDVPDALFASVSLFKGLGAHTVSAAYRYDGCRSGIDIGSPEFTPDRFPETKEIFHAVELGWSLTTGARSTWGLSIARTIDGRNTDRKTAFVASVTF